MQLQRTSGNIEPAKLQLLETYYFRAAIKPSDHPRGYVSEHCGVGSECSSVRVDQGCVFPCWWTYNVHLHQCHRSSLATYGVDLKLYLDLLLDCSLSHLMDS